jgi:hypothetical protein
LSSLQEPAKSIFHLSFLNEGLCGFATAPVRKGLPFRALLEIIKTLDGKASLTALGSGKPHSTGHGFGRR